MGCEMDRTRSDLFEFEQSVIAMAGATDGHGGRDVDLDGLLPVPPRHRNLGPGLVLGNLFIAIFPSAASCTAILDVGLHDCHIYSLAGNFVPRECFHISLAGLVDFSGETPPTEYVDAAKYVAERIQMRPFEVTLERTANFSGRGGSSAYVLTVGYGKDKLTELHLRLAMQLRTMGVRFRSSYNPHVTMLYDRIRPPVHEITPISWTVGEFVLVHSHVGQSRYTVLERWPLVG